MLSAWLPFKVIVIFERMLFIPLSRDGFAVRVRRTRPRAHVNVAAAAMLIAMLPVFAVAQQKAPAAKPFESIAGCVLQPDEWTDGDSFRTRLPDGRLETFRLYFVDTTESRASGHRSDEQAAYFGLTRAQAVQLGEEAKKFTAKVLEKPFTVHTRWRSLFGIRSLGMVTTSTGEDLGELLVKKGLARVSGVRTPLPDGRDSRTYLAHLAELEAAAKRDRLGGWKR